MNSTTNWQDFCSLYYDQAVSIAKCNLGKIRQASSRWNERLDEDVLAEDAAIDAMQKAFGKYDSTRGASMATYLSRLIHNELVDAVKRESKHIPVGNDLNESQEADYSLKSVVSRIPDSAMDNLKEKLRAAILKLSPLDQSILGFFLEDPGTFVERSVKFLNVTPNVVSVRKNRALGKLPSLMGVSQKEYYDLFEEQSYAGLQKKVPLYCMSIESFGARIAYENPVFPQFDLDGTVLRLYDAICEAASAK